MVELVWVEQMWDKSGWWLRLRDSERYPNGKAVELHRWKSLHDADSLEELDSMLGMWGLTRKGILHEDAGGKKYVTVAPSA